MGRKEVGMLKVRKSLYKHVVLTLALGVLLGLSSVFGFAGVRAEAGVSQVADDGPTLITEMNYDATDLVSVASEEVTQVEQKNTFKALSSVDSGIFGIPTDTPAASNLYIYSTAKGLANVPEDATNFKVDEVNWDIGKTIDGIYAYSAGELSTNSNYFTISKDSSQEDQWLFSLKDNITQQIDDEEVTVKITGGTFLCKCSWTETDDTGQEREKNQDVDLDIDDFSILQVQGFAPTSTYKISLNNAQALDAAKIGSVFDTTIQNATYAEPSTITVSDLTAANPDKYEFSATITPEQNAINEIDCEVPKDTKTLNISFTPKAYYRGNIDVCISLLLNQKAFANRTFTVNGVGKRSVAFHMKVSTIESRFYEAQMGFITSVLNQNDGDVSYWNGFLADDVQEGKIVTDVKLEYTPDATKSVQATFTYSLVEELADKYEIGSMQTQTSVQVDPPSAGNYSDILFKNDSGDSCNGEEIKNTWLNWKQIFASSQFDKLMISHVFEEKSNEDSNYSTSCEMNSAQGAYSGVTLYYYNPSVSFPAIQVLSDVAYNLDRTAPKVTYNSQETPDYKDIGILRLFDNYVTERIGVSDEYSSKEDTSNSDMPKPEASGINAQESYLNYTDSYSGTTQNADYHSQSNNQGEFEFTLNNNEQVDLSNINTHLEDNAGNVFDGTAEDTWELPAEIRELVVASNKPTINVITSNDKIYSGGVFKDIIKARFEITDPTFKYTQEYEQHLGDMAFLKISEDGKSGKEAIPSDFKKGEGDTYYFEYSFDKQVDYRFEFSACNLLGQYADNSISASFTIDLTNPTVSVDYDNNDVHNGNYYQAARTATITVTDRNFNPATMNVIASAKEVNGTLGGNAVISPSDTWVMSDLNNHERSETHTCTVYFPGTGEYSLEIPKTDVDLAGNSLSNPYENSFIVSLEEPTINIAVDGQENASSHSYQGNCPLSVSVTDPTIDPAQTSITVTPKGINPAGNSSENPYASSQTQVSGNQIEYSAPSPAATPQNDNLYQVLVKAYDYAGHYKTAEVEWSVNRFGSVYYLSEETQNMINEKYVNKDHTNNVIVNEINPSTVSSSSASVSMSINDVHKTLTQGTDYTFASSSSSTGWPTYQYVINRDNFSEDGQYSLTVGSIDTAGNTSMNNKDQANAERNNSVPISFIEDNKAPVITFSGFNDSEVHESSHEVGFTIEDESGCQSVKMYKNGNLEKDLSKEDLNDSDSTYSDTLYLTEENDPQNLTVVAVDKAGNEANKTSGSVFVNTNPFLIWLHNPVAVALTCVGAGGGVAVAGFFAVRHIRLKKGKA